MNYETSCQTSTGSKTEYQADQRFDDLGMRHYLNGECTVLHCHHYATLFSQLASDAAAMEGPALLTESSAKSFHKVLQRYFTEYAIQDTCDRIAIAEQYWSFAGMGQVQFEFGEQNGTATMQRSHVDEGWIKKWGQREEPINYVGRGFVKAAWAAVYDKDIAACQVTEEKSIVCGDDCSQFTLQW